jgi:hypothetical protein
MPKLLLLAICERTARDVSSGELSLLTLINGWTVVLPNEVDDASVAVVPVRWSVVSTWYREDDDPNLQFEQSIIVDTPTGKSTNPIIHAFNMEKRVGTLAISTDNIPVVGSGIYNVRMSVRSVISDGDQVTYGDWQEKAVYPLEVTISRDDGPIEAQEEQGELVNP